MPLYLAVKRQSTPKKDHAFRTKNRSTDRADERSPKKGNLISGNPDPEDSLDISDLLNSAIGAMDFDPQSLRRSITERKTERSRPVDKRLATVAIALVVLIFLVDLIVPYM